MDDNDMGHHRLQSIQLVARRWLKSCVQLEKKPFWPIMLGTTMCEKTGLFSETTVWPSIISHALSIFIQSMVFREGADYCFFHCHMEHFSLDIVKTFCLFVIIGGIIHSTCMLSTLIWDFFSFFILFNTMLNIIHSKDSNQKPLPLLHHAFLSENSWGSFHLLPSVFPSI